MNNMTICKVDIFTHLLRRALADKLLHVAIVPANAYYRNKFQLSILISFRDIRRFQSKKWEFLISPDAP